MILDFRIKLKRRKNVSMSIFDISSTGATIIIKDTNVTPSLYGEWYKIEKRDRW